MDITKIRQLHNKLNDDITLLISKFEKETTMMVKDVSIYRINAVRIDDKNRKSVFTGCIVTIEA